MSRLLAPLLGWVLGAAVLAASLAMALSEMWAPAVLLGHGGALLWGWATWRQDPVSQRDES